MKNIRDIREDKKLYFLLPEDIMIGKFICHENVAVIIYLFYEEYLYKYLSYIDKIPQDFNIYIVSSNNKLYEMINWYRLQNQNKRIELVKKENRGRDISALLVACREICLKYEYICFVHDKKKKEWIPELDFELWIENLWGNSLGTEKYILNLLYLLERNTEIGILVPPEPIGTYLNAWYINAWGNNFEIAQKLTEELKLNCDLDISKSPITLGTVFWARSIALKKLFEKEWSYLDFNEEPLNENGTISHAIERIIGYVVQDAGYNIGTVMNISYARTLLSYTQKNLSAIYQLLEDDYGFSDVEDFLQKRKEIYEFCQKNKKVYLYGAGKIGKGCLRLLRAEGYKPLGYIISNVEQKNQKIEGLPVQTLAEITNIADTGIIITVSRKMQAEIVEKLKINGIENYIKYLG